MHNWDEVEAYVSSRYNVTWRSEFMVFFDLPNGQRAMIQEAEAAGFDYETLRAEVGGFEDDLDSAYQLLKTVAQSANGLFTCEEVAGRLFVRHMIPTLVLNGPMLDAFMQGLGSIAAELAGKIAAGQLRPQLD